MSAHAANSGDSSRSSLKKKLICRAAPDRSQRTRRIVQWAFVALNGWIAVQFFLWVRWFERGGQGWQVSRPPPASKAGCRLPDS